MDNILEVSGINKSYDDFSLKDISFYLPEGCITGFVGINGAGKTTTLRSILGLTNNVSGKINFFDKVFLCDNRPRSARHRCGKENPRNQSNK